MNKNKHSRLEKYYKIVIALAIVTLANGCATTEPSNKSQGNGGMPYDLLNNNYSRYKTIDDLIQAFSDSGAPIQHLENGNVAVVTYDVSSRLVTDFQKEPLDKICTSMMGKPPRDKSRSTTPLRDEHGYYLYSYGGPMVDFEKEMRAVSKLVMTENTVRMNQTTAFCTTYKEYKDLRPKVSIIYPLFLSFEICEDSAKKSFLSFKRQKCHWVILKSEYFKERVRMEIAEDTPNHIK